MKHLKKFSTEADVDVNAYPNVCVVADTNKVLYNVMPKGVFIQHINGALYDTEDWSAIGFSNDEANGVVVNTNEASFVVAKDNASDSAMWLYNGTLVDGVFTTTDKAEATADFSGQKNTEFIDAEGAGSLCANYTFPNGQRGYLPALGEMYVLYNNKTDVDKALELIGGRVIGNVTYWTSTQYSAVESWCIITTQASRSGSNKTITYRVRPFTKLL